MRTSIATVCLSGTLAEKMRAAADAGFDGIEIFEQDLVVWAVDDHVLPVLFGVLVVHGHLVAVWDLETIAWPFGHQGLGKPLAGMLQNGRRLRDHTVREVAW